MGKGYNKWQYLQLLVVVLQTIMLSHCEESRKAYRYLCAPWSSPLSFDWQELHPDTHLVFIGDSTTFRLTDLLPQNPDSTPYHYSDRCGLNLFWGLDTPSEWAPPNRSFEGPTAYGALNPNCQDCSGCSSKILSSFTIPSHYTFEFYSIEFARDVEIQTSKYSTTQENLINTILIPKYSGFNFVYIIIQLGLHDMALEQPEEAFEQNLSWLIEMLQTALPQAQLIIRAVEGSRGEYEQTVYLVASFQEIAAKVSLRHCVHFFMLHCDKNVDTLRSNLLDNVHHSAEVYKWSLSHLWRLIRVIQANSAETSTETSEDNNSCQCPCHSPNQLQAKKPHCHIEPVFDFPQ